MFERPLCPLPSPLDGVAVSCMRSRVKRFHGSSNLPKMVHFTPCQRCFTHGAASSAFLLLGRTQDREVARVDESSFWFCLIAGPYESSFSSAQTNHAQTHAPSITHIIITHTHRRGSSVVPRVKQRPHRASEQLDFYATHALISRQLQRDAQLQRNKVEQIIFAP